MFISNLFKSLSYSLVVAGQSGSVVNGIRIKLDNAIAITHAVGALLILAVLKLIGVELSGIYACGIIVGFLAVIALNAFHNHLFAKIWLVLFSHQSLVVLLLTVGVQTGFHFLFIVFMCLPFLLFNIYQHWYIFLSFLMSISCFFLFHTGVIPTHNLPHVSDVENIAIVFCYGLIGMYGIGLLISFHKMERSYTIVNEDFNDELEAAKLALQKLNMDVQGKDLAHIVNLLHEKAQLASNIAFHQSKAIEKIIAIKNRSYEKLYKQYTAADKNTQTRTNTPELFNWYLEKHLRTALINLVIIIGRLKEYDAIKTSEALTQQLENIAAISLENIEIVDRMGKVAYIPAAIVVENINLNDLLNTLIIQRNENVSLMVDWPTIAGQMEPMQELWLVIIDLIGVNNLNKDIVCRKEDKHYCFGITIAERLKEQRDYKKFNQNVLLKILGHWVVQQGGAFKTLSVDTFEFTLPAA